MTKRRREADPDDAAAETAELNTVFVDTSLDTHLAMLICTSDTVSDFKKKVALEHMQCFPEMGEIQVHSVKVKRRSTFYHLPDIMFVWSAFHGVKKNWFLSVDASCIHTSELGTSSGLKIGVTNTDDDCRGFTYDANRNDILSLSLQDGAAEKNAVSEMIARPKVDKPVEKTTDSHRSIYSEEHFTGAESHAKKKRKVSHSRDEYQNSRDECQNSSLGGGKDGKHTISESVVKVSGVRNDQYDVEGKLVSDGISPPTMAEKSNSQNINGSDRRKENNGFESVFDHGPGQDDPTQHSGVVNTGGGGDVHTAGSRRKKKKVQNTVAKVQDTTDTEHFEKCERIEPSADTHKCDQMEGQGFPLKNDHEVMMPINSKAPGQVEPDLALAEASLLQDAKKCNFSIVNSLKSLDSNGRKEDHEPGQDVPTQHSGVISLMVPDSSAKLMDVSGEGGDVNTAGSRRKKKKDQNTVAKVQDTTDTEHFGKCERIEPSADTHKCDQMEGLGFPLKNDHEVMMPINSKAPGQVEPDLALAEASLLQDAKKCNFSIVNSLKSLDSNGRKEDHEPGQDVPTQHSGVISLMVPDSSARLMDVSGEGGDVNTAGSRRKKKKVQNTVAKVQDTTDTEHFGKCERIEPSADTHKCDQMEGHGFSLKNDHEVMMPINSKAPGQVEPDLALAEASLLQDAKKCNFSIVNSLKILDSNGRKEDHGPGQDVPTQHSGVVSVMVPDSSARLMDVSGGGGDVNTAGSRRKKKKVQNTVAKVQDTTDTEHFGKCERIGPSADTHKCDQMERQGFSLKNDHEVMMPINSKAPGQVEPDLALAEASLLQDAKKCNFSIVNSLKILDSNGRKEDHGPGQDVPTQHSGVVSVMVPDSSARLMDVSGGGGDVNTAGSRRKKKKVQNTVAKVQDTTDTEHFGKCERIGPSADTHKCDQMERQGFSLKNDHKVMMPINSKAPGQVEPDLALAEASLLQDAKKCNFSIVNSLEILDSNGRKENNVLENKLDYELDQDVPTVQSGGVCTNRPNLADAAGGIRDVNTDGKKRKKKKLQTTAAKVQDTKDVEQIGNGEMEKPHSETINSKEKEEQKGASLEHDLDSITLDHVDPNLALKEASLVRDADAVSVIEPEISSGIKKRKKKKREKKPLGASIENSGITEIQNGIRGSLGLPSPSNDHIPKETGKEENIKLNEGKDVQMKLLDGSNHDAQEKVWDVNRRETDLEIKTQTEQTVVDVSVVKRIMAENTKSAAGDCNADLPTAETGNTMMESNEADKDNGNTENGDRKAKNKRKKKKHTATDVQEKEVRHVDSSQILSRKSEEEADKMHELAVNTDDVAENSAKGSEDINFKQYFVPGQLQNKVDSRVEVRKGTKLQGCSKRAKDDDLPGVNISTELQNSSKSFENSKTKNNSYRKDSGRAKGDYMQNSDWDEISHHSFKRSSVAPEIEVKDSSPSELREVTRQKRNGIVAAPTIRNKNPSLDKSIPQKKILLANLGAIFQDFSGESSGDENGIMHSNDRTISSSDDDNSSMSGDSTGESELSHNSTSKGSNDAKGKSTSNLDMSMPASKDMTIEMILKSSKRFKKAKEVASQTECQPIDFVPESQPF